MQDVCTVSLSITEYLGCSKLINILNDYVYCNLNVYSKIKGDGNKNPSPGASISPISVHRPGGRKLLAPLICHGLSP